MRCDIRVASGSEPPSQRFIQSNVYPKSGYQRMRSLLVPAIEAWSVGSRRWQSAPCSGMVRAMTALGHPTLMRRLRSGFAIWFVSILLLLQANAATWATPILSEADPGPLANWVVCTTHGDPSSAPADRRKPNHGHDHCWSVCISCCPIDLYQPISTAGMPLPAESGRIERIAYGRPAPRAPPSTAHQARAPPSRSQS